MFVEADIDPDVVWDELSDQDRYEYVISYLSSGCLPIETLLDDVGYSSNEIEDFCKEFLKQQTPLHKALNET